MAELSPAAQAVLDAATNVFYRPLVETPYCHNRVVAAALRAAAVPFHWTWNAEMCHKHLIAIAAELEGAG